jgi:predicted dehydrogenase
MSSVHSIQNSPVKVGLVGFGLAGRAFHAPLIHASPHLRLTHIVQRRGDEAKAAYPEVQVVRDVAELLTRPDVDLVVVATPNATHFEISANALRAGKHVVVDKPFVATSQEADELIAIAQSNKRVLSVFQNRRWDGDFRTVRQILEQKRIGRLVEFESRFDRFRPSVRANAWKEQPSPGAGVLYDLGPHLIDQALLLFGKPHGVYAEIRIQRDGAIVADSFQVHLQYDEVKVVLRAAVLVCEPSPRFVLYGTEGSYVKYGLDPQEDAMKQGGSPRQPEWGEEPEPAWGTLSRCDGGLHREKYRTLPGCYQDYYENVYRAIRGLGELAVTPEQAREVIRMIELAIQSAREERMIPVP